MLSCVTTCQFLRERCLRRDDRIRPAAFLVGVGSRWDRKSYSSSWALLDCGSASCPGVVVGVLRSSLGWKAGRGGAARQKRRFAKLWIPQLQGVADFLHGRFPAVTKGHDQPPAFGQVVDCPGQEFPHLGMQVTKQRIVFGAGPAGKPVPFSLDPKIRIRGTEFQIPSNS